VLPGVVTAKQVDGLPAVPPQKVPTTCGPPTVIPEPLRLALVRTRKYEVVVPGPVVSRQRVWLPRPPHAPLESEPKLTLVTVVVPPTLMPPEKPITGPPVRTAPEVIWTSTQTEVLAMAAPLQVPPWVMVTVPTVVLPTVILSVVAEAAGAMARAATTTKARTESLRLVILTTKSPLNESNCTTVTHYYWHESCHPGEHTIVP